MDIDEREKNKKYKNHFQFRKTYKSLDVLIELNAFRNFHTRYKAMEEKR